MKENAALPARWATATQLTVAQGCNNLHTSAAAAAGTQTGIAHIARTPNQQHLFSIRGVLDGVQLLKLIMMWCLN
jgi:hypothetical protein